MKNSIYVLILILTFFSLTVCFGDARMKKIVIEKHDLWNRAMRDLGYWGSECGPFFRLKEFQDIIDLGLPAIPAIVELTEKNAFLSAAIKRIAKLRLREKYIGHTKIFPDFQEIKILLHTPRYWWSEIRPNIRFHFDRFYAAWKEAKRTGAEDLPEKFKNVACLGVDVLPFLVEKISQGDTELTELISYLTDGEVRSAATPEECKSWWEENHAKWTIPSD